MNFDLQAVIAKGYIYNLRDDVKKGLEEKVAQGGWPASAPLGYRNNRDTHTCDIDQYKAPFVGKMFELYATGVSATVETHGITIPFELSLES